MNPHKTIARHQAQVEAAEAADGPPARARTRQGEHLLQLVESYAARVAAEGWTERTDTACLHIYPPLPDEGLWEIADSAALCFRDSIQAATLAEAVEAALAELKP